MTVDNALQLQEDFLHLSQGRRALVITLQLDMCTILLHIKLLGMYRHQPAAKLKTPVTRRGTQV